MFYNNNTLSNVDLKLKNAFLAYKDKILVSTKKDRTQEGFNGHSKVKFNEIHIYYLAIHYITLLYLEYNGWNNDMASIKENWKYNEIKKCFACLDINLDDILVIYGIDEDSIPDPVVRLVKTITIEEIYSLLEGCQSYFETCGGGNSIIPIPNNPGTPSGLIVFNMYYGSSQLTTINEAIVLNTFTHGTSTTISVILNFPAAPGYKYIGFPLTQAALVNNFVDPINPFNIAMELTTQDVVINGETIRFYRTFNQLNGTVNIKVI